MLKMLNYVSAREEASVKTRHYLLYLILSAKKHATIVTNMGTWVKEPFCVSSSLPQRNYSESELTVPAMETNFTIAEMKEHSIMDNLAISNLQVITESSRSGPKFKPMICTSIEKVCRRVKGCEKCFAMKCFVVLWCTYSALYCLYFGCLFLWNMANDTASIVDTCEQKVR